MTTLITQLFKNQSSVESLLRRESNKSYNRFQKLFADRRYFYEHLRKECAFTLFTRKELKEKPFLLHYVFERKEKMLWLKKKKTTDGNGLARIDKYEFSSEGLLKWMGKHGFEFLELEVSQSEYVYEFAPKGVSTLNVLTWMGEEGKMRVLGSAMQLSAFSPLDSMASGGIWLNLDPEFGFPLGPGKQIFPEEKSCKVHPLSSTSMNFFVFMEMDEVKVFVKKCYQKLNSNGLFSWEIVIQDQVPKLMGISPPKCIDYWIQLGEQGVLSFKVQDLIEGKS